MAKVEMYSKDYCPYCVRAKTLLKTRGVEIIEYNIEHDRARQREMLERVPGARTVPQIFINDRAIGGCDDLMALDAAGKLRGMLDD